MYSGLINTIWIKDFDTKRCAGILRAAVYDDCLYDCGINIVKLAIYYIVRYFYTRPFVSSC